MGRAYPNMYQSLPAAFDVPNRSAVVVYVIENFLNMSLSLTPCAIADGVNNSVVLTSTSDKFHVETM